MINGKKGALPDIAVSDSNCLDFRFIPDKYLPKILTALMILAMVCVVVKN